MNPFFAAMLFCTGAAVFLIAVGPSLLPETAQRRLAALLLGLLGGFVTIPLPMLWILAVPVAIALGAMYIRDGHVDALGLMLLGAGVVWTSLWGWSAWNDATDPAVSGPSVTGYLAIGVAMLVGGAAFLAGSRLTGRHGA